MIETKITSLLLVLYVSCCVCSKISLPETGEKVNGKPAVIIPELEEQIKEDIKSGYWDKSVELMKRHLNESSQAYKEMDNITQYDNYPLRAAEKGYAELLQVMLHNGLPVRNTYAVIKYGRYDYTLLLKAAWFGRYDVVQLLIDHKADMDQGDLRNTKPLHWAAVYGHVNIVQQLVENGAERNPPNIYGDTPLHYAAKHGHKPVVQLLVETGCDTIARNHDGKTPWDIAKTEEIRETLIKLEKLSLNK